jgi:drug/metabolite transporter (DMT)-like permease
MVETEPATKLFMRSGFACIALLIYVAIRHRGQVIKAFRDLGWAGVIVGCCFATASSCFIFALEYTTVANIMFIQAAAPFFAGLLGWLLMREPVGLRSWICMAVVLSGIGIMMIDSFGGGGMVGNLLSIVMMMGFASAIVVTPAPGDPHGAGDISARDAAGVAFNGGPVDLSTPDIAPSRVRRRADGVRPGYVHRGHAAGPRRRPG